MSLLMQKEGAPLNNIGIPVVVKQVGNQLISDAQLPVGLVAVSLGLAPGPTTTQFSLRNVSTGGQQIRIGSAPDFTPGFENGMLLFPGDSFHIENVAAPPDILAIADAAGGQLAALKWQAP